MTQKLTTNSVTIIPSLYVRHYGNVSTRLSHGARLEQHGARLEQQRARCLDRKRAFVVSGGGGGGSDDAVGSGLSLLVVVVVVVVVLVVVVVVVVVLVVVVVVEMTRLEAGFHCQWLWW